MPKPGTSFKPTTKTSKVTTIVGSGETPGIVLNSEQEIALSTIPTLTEGIPTLTGLQSSSTTGQSQPLWTTLLEEEGSTSTVPEVDLEEVDATYKTLMNYAKENNLGGKMIKDYSKNSSFIDRGLFNIALYEYLTNEISEAQALGMLKGMRMERQRAQAQTSRDTEHAMQKFITEQENFLTLALDKLRQSGDNERNCIHVLRQTMDTLNRLEKQKLDSTLTPKSTSPPSSISTEPPEASVAFGNLLLGCNSNGIITSYQVIKTPVNLNLWKQIGDFLIGVPSDFITSIQVLEFIKKFRKDNPSQSDNTKWVSNLL